MRAQNLEVERSKFRQRMSCVKDLVPSHCAQLSFWGRGEPRRGFVVAYRLRGGGESMIRLELG